MWLKNSFCGRVEINQDDINEDVRLGAHCFSQFTCSEKKKKRCSTGEVSLKTCEM